MAPSRRRGAGKAAAAAAALRHWKVGDLVLAKVKGFPAWPATVSEPEKWGYQADLKKVLVYFFGTQQIAFCNPADVEAFTEEKKQSLLVKRQGKGADFVRAVREIIESYEKSKKMDQVDDQNSGKDVTLAHVGNSKESSANMESKDQNENSEAAVTVTNSPNLVGSIAPDVTKIDSLQDKVASVEQPLDDVAVTAKPGITTYTSRKRSGGLRSRKRATQKTDSTVDTNGSLSRLDSGRLHSFIMSPNDGNKSAGDASTEIIFERSLRRNKRIRKSPVVSEWHDDVDSSAFVSNGSIGDNGSEIVTIDSDSVSLYDNSTQDSACKPEHCETVVECLEGDVELSKGLDFQIKAVVIKKKRKPNRKRMTNEAAEPPARLETGMDLDAVLQNSVQNSQNAGENLNERHNKEDGDEHLPLVKRARVRMGKLSTLEDGNDSLSQAVERTSNDAAVNPVELPNGLCEVERTPEDIRVTSMDHVGPSTDHINSDIVKGSSDNVSPQRACTQIPGNRLHVSVIKENQPFGSSADGEAALPPSKRLHRALEAMSANAAEQVHPCAEKSAMKTLINGSCTSSVKGSSHVTERKESDGSDEQAAESFIHRSSDFCSSDTVSETAVKSSLDAHMCNQPIGNSKNQEHQEEALGHGHCKNLSESCFGGLSVCAAAEQRTEDLTHKLDRKQSSLQSNQDSVDQLSLVKDKGDLEDIVLRDVGAEIANKDVKSECSRTYSRLISQASEATSQNGSAMLQYNAEDTESLRSQIDKNQANGMLEELKEIKYDHREQDSSYVSISNDQLGEKGVLVPHLSPVPADGIESPVQTSPTTASVCHVSTSESANFVQNSGGSSPNHSQQKTTVSTTVDEEKIESTVPQRPKSVGKLSTYAEAHAALSSFEGILGSLTRTKESIGRATRIAIDCAKFGVSSKVVEILARNLESESSLHRRVDLFFLVDSIAQCSRGLKGDVGGIYPSAIQAVLPRLLSVAAPPGNFAQENRRQCMKVLRLWLERRILPESVIRHHMRELDSLGASSSGGVYSRRSARTERALDDPVRDMEGMLVDEYGSNSSFQLPGFCMPRMLKDEDGGSDSDGESFEAVTPEHNPGTPEEPDNTPAIEKHTHILEDVDGELEMEDVAPSCEVEVNPAGCIAGVNAVNNLHHQLENFPLPYAPPLPQDGPPSSPPLPTSPPPPPPPPPPPAGPHSRIHEPYINGVDSKIYTNSHNMHDDLRESAAQHSASRTNPSIFNGVHHHASECREMQPSDSMSSFSSYPVRPVNNVQHTDAPSFQHKPYPPRPPQPPPSNQFSYVQAGQHVKPRRETTPPYQHRFHSSYSGDGGTFYNNHERMRPAPYEPGDGWRYPSANIPGPRYPDKARAYPPGPYGGPPREPTRIHHQEWPLPPRGMHQRNFMPYRPSSESGVPVSDRAPSIWRPR
ncbi:protein HUA2-LIKE 2-like isoform X2 [Euphorbia lathyris]|uniref:protein HUA2-LIKE 2-like isoform X2 n=1 Tax=Euphorbia lathyris TaxID=212925 RepID=UPI003313F199